MQSCLSSWRADESPTQGRKENIPDAVESGASGEDGSPCGVLLGPRPRPHGSTSACEFKVPS
eukprot:4026198-Alexandrium_andersonii.AAC.1